MTGIVLVWSLPLVLAKAEVNCRADSARVRVDMLDHQRTSFGSATGSVRDKSPRACDRVRFANLC
ncbi:hypothetical protein [Microcoleus vaginatus]|uniref:hypothetical protein n=1 Tax=Microcoleus vaginatus TaxID=119532 RepID=UPI001F620144